MTVYFEVLLYAGVLTIALIADPDHGPDLDGLTGRLHQWRVDLRANWWTELRAQLEGSGPARDATEQ
jgi:hypothetical protein